MQKGSELERRSAFLSPRAEREKRREEEEEERKG
jgi:hypothetical protein